MQKIAHALDVGRRRQVFPVDGEGGDRPLAAGSAQRREHAFIAGAALGAKERDLLELRAKLLHVRPHRRRQAQLPDRRPDDDEVVTRRVARRVADRRRGAHQRMPARTPSGAPAIVLMQLPDHVQVGMTALWQFPWRGGWTARCGRNRPPAFSWILVRAVASCSVPAPRRGGATPT